MTALGEAVSHLLWLAPRTASLVALARPEDSTWSIVRNDPGCVLLVLRFASAAASPSKFSPALLRDPSVLQAAHRLLGQPGPIDWHEPGCHPIYQSALIYAELAA